MDHQYRLHYNRLLKALTRNLVGFAKYWSNPDMACEIPMAPDFSLCISRRKIGLPTNPMEINFYNEDVRVRKPPRTLNPARLEVANQIFDELVDSGFAVPSNHEFSSPVCLVVYPDHCKPRLTGDYSGKDGVNANTIPVEPNLPRISDVLVFLSQANYIGTLDPPPPKPFGNSKLLKRTGTKQP
ncbi:hypothetical protein P9112_009966 [Eukaryota sp. TZLM1-RC]